MRFSGNQLRFILPVFILLIAIILLQLFEPVLLNNKKKNWNKELNVKNELIEKSVKNIFNEKIDSLKFILNKVKKIIKNENGSQEKIIPLINQHALSKFSVVITDSNGEVFAWTRNILFNNFNPRNSNKINNVSITKSNLIVYLTYNGLLDYDSTAYYISVSLPLEKEYRLQNKYFQKISLTGLLSSKFNTQFEINYSGKNPHKNDGRYYSFFVENNNNKIALVTFKKPNFDINLNNYRQNLKNIKYVLLITVLLLLGVYLFIKLKELNNKAIKYFTLLSYLVILRYTVYVSGLVSSWQTSGISNPAYFSSSFAFGIVKSPVELFVTCIFVLVFVIQLYTFVLGISNKKTTVNKSVKLYFITTISLLLIFFLTYRGFAASIRSVIFDSTLVYFNDHSLFPNVTTGLMYINVLLMGFIFLLISFIILLIIYVFAKSVKNFNLTRFLLIQFFVFQLFGIFFDLVQNNPQGNSLIRILFVTFTFLLLIFHILSKHKKFIKFIYILFAGSAFSVILMIFYNNQLEKESLKIYARDLINPNDGWLEFLVRESLLNDFTRKEALEAFDNPSTNFDASAFKIWSKSSLQKESFISEIGFLDYNKKFLGGFGFRISELPGPNWSNLKNVLSDITIFKENLPNSGAKIIRGIFPVKNDYALLGYVEASVIFDIGNFGFAEPPEFLKAPPLHQKQIVQTGELKILEFINDSLKNVWGDIRISYPDVDKIDNIKLNKEHEAFRIINLNGANYKIYISQVIRNKKTKKIAVAIREKDLSFQIFNFFKIFFFHSLLILLIILIYFVYILSRKKEIKISLQTKLLIAFLIVSLIPLILLALYFRNLTEQKNKDAVFYKLGKRAYSIETYTNDHLTPEADNIYEVFEKASSELNINFSVFKNKKVSYSTESLFYEISLIPKLINPFAFNTIENLGAQDYITIDAVEKYKYNSFYYLANINHKYYIIQVSDAFNNISLPMSGNEVDAFLVASYSLAVLLVLILSSILANQISKPIRKLTQATVAVASGDLDIQLEEKAGGEVDDLIKGFNYMVHELKRNQLQLAEVEREAAWKEMAKQVAHEIKNPLTPMKLATQQLIAAFKDNSHKFENIFNKVTGTIINQIETLSKIATEFSNFAKMPSLKIERIDLRKVIKESIDLFLEESAGISFASELENVFIEADYDQLKRTLINLIRNSLQAGATEIEITLNSNEDSEHFDLRIKDNGCGISDENLPKIFDYNFTTKDKGMGIGLSLAKKYLEFIHATIQVEQTTNRGTTILIRFRKSK